MGDRVREKKKAPATLVDAIRSMALDGEFDPPPSPQGRAVVLGTDHSRVASITLRVETPGGVPPELRGALERTVHACTVHSSICQAPAVCLEIVTTEPARA